uniref:Structural protein n=1 Tax=Periparus ater ambidensovirus TaxID=2794455 RepID=A0A8A4XC48_9VIRU|nr:MAG: structural protein [Periparus ater ambidensovirus]
MPKTPSAKLIESRARYADEQRKLAEVHRGKYFTPPRLSDSEPEKSPSPQDYSLDSPIRTPEHPLTPGRHIEEEESSEAIEMSSGQDIPTTATNPSGLKRGAESAASDGAGGKQAKTSNKKLPGTAKPQSLEGNSDRSIIYLERPFNSKTIVISKFSKQHKFLTFGIASKIISKPIAEHAPIPAHTIYYLTTALAEIPVHKLPLFLNPSEFGKLPVGSEILELKVTVVQRNALLSFQTNASTTNLATLNQNKNGVFSIGLNKTNYGLNRRYTAFATEETMIPTNCGPPVYEATTSAPAYEGLQEDLYGVDNTSATFSTSLPKHQTGMYTTLKNYFCMTHTNKYKGGWPLLQEKVTEYDAAALVGEIITEYTYHPKVGLIKIPQNYLPTQIPYNNLRVPHGTMKSSPEDYLYNGLLNPSADELIDYENKSKSIFDSGNFDYYADIEKSQFYSQGPGGVNSAKIQPSLHIGIMPVPALTTKSIINGDTNSNFTDTRSYFDVHCEATVGVRQYTDRPFADEYNCAFGETYYRNTIKPNSNAVPLGTLYPSNAIVEA